MRYKVRMSDALNEIISAEPLDLDAIAAALDSASPNDRLETVRGLNKPTQRRLFEAAEGRGGLTIDDIVPSSKAPRTEVIHEGKNSLPVFKCFQKRFCRIAHNDERLAGYNEQSMRWATGPGYFLVRAADDVEGEVDIDYTLIPDDSDRVESWPEILPQKARLGRFVYAGMVDRLRRVSTHVTIGRAIIKGKATHNYFLLCRQD